jgi:hypothetical protein
VDGSAGVLYVEPLSSNAVERCKRWNNDCLRNKGELVDAGI